MQHKVVIFSKYLAKKCYPLLFTYFYIVRDPSFVVRSLDFISKRPRSGVVRNRLFLSMDVPK